MTQQQLLLILNERLTVKEKSSERGYHPLDPDAQLLCSFQILNNIFYFSCFKPGTIKQWTVKPLYHLNGSIKIGVL